MKLHFAQLLDKSVLSCFPASASLSMKTAIAPSRAQPRAIAAPMPFAPPVMRTTLSLSSKSMLLVASGAFRDFQTIKVCRVADEDVFSHVGRAIAQILFKNLHDLPIAGGQQAHGPVRPKHQAVRAKRIKDYIQIGAKIFFLPLLPVGFGRQTGELAINVWVGGNFLHQNGPAGAMAEFDLGFGEMVDDERLFRKAPDEFERRVQLFRIDENVVGEAEMAQAGDAAEELFADEEPIVGLGLGEVAKTAELFKLRKEMHSLGDLRRAQINPADYAGDACIALGKLQQEQGFVLRLVGLDDDGGVDVVCMALRVEMFGEIIAFQDGHFVGDPRVARGIVIPEVLVRIDSHWQKLIVISVHFSKRLRKQLPRTACLRRRARDDTTASCIEGGLQSIRQRASESGSRTAPTP